MRGELNLLEYAIDTNRNARAYICEQSFAVFAMYYFWEFFTYAIPEFHWKMYKELEELTQGKFRFLLWVMFRESAKTSIAKIYVIYCIVFRKKRFINYDSYDKGNAEAALFDIARELQTNHRLIADFGQLYYEEKRRDEQQTKIKRINEFVTANQIKVKAYSTQESTRGRIFHRFRPDLYIIDDFETEITAKSAPITAKIMAHLDTMKTGMAVDGQAIFLCNLISEVGSVASLIEETRENPASWRFHRVDVIMNGEIMWPDKYVKDNAEAAIVNAKIQDAKTKKISLEQKKKDLNANGRKIYEQEMLNNPEAAGEPFFNRERIDLSIALAKKKSPIKIVGDLSIWEPYAAKYRYAFGGDTAKGVTRDSCTSVGMRFAPSDGKSAIVVATYASNTIAPDAFGDEMAAHGRLFGECLLAPELNNTGYATVTRLKAIYPLPKLYRQVKQDQVGSPITKDLGWEANASNVSTIYFNFRSAYEDGHIEIYCPALLAEMRAFTKRDLEGASRRNEIDQVGLKTRHFDLLRAACIAWEMRMHATLSTLVKKYKQTEHQSTSDYQG